MLIHLTYITKHMGSDGLVIDAQGTLGDVEAFELV